MIDLAQELAFQNDVIAQLRAAEWKLGSERSPPRSLPVTW
jgi:hypothetical protein